MIDIKALAIQHNISAEALLSRLQDFLIYAQVHLAELEDAIDSREFYSIVRHAHKIASRAERLGLGHITLHTEHIEILATFRRDTEYEILFEDLRQSLIQLQTQIRLHSQIPAG